MLDIVLRLSKFLSAGCFVQALASGRFACHLPPAQKGMREVCCCRSRRKGFELALLSYCYSC